MEPKDDAVSRFGTRAQSYAAFRPNYPPQAIDAVLGGLGHPSTLTIADVGAGTGIASRLFARRGATVIAIEPNERMRSQAEPHPNVRWVDGTAQRTGLPDACIHLAVACQAFHWFAEPQAMSEFSRIARHRAALLQYERDERDAFTRAYGDVVRSFATDDTELLRARGLDVFANFPNSKNTVTESYFTQDLDRAALFGRAASSSYLPATGEAAERLKRSLEDLFTQYQRAGVVTLHMVTYALTADFER